MADALKNDVRVSAGLCVAVCVPPFGVRGQRRLIELRTLSLSAAK